MLNSIAFALSEKQLGIAAGLFFVLFVLGAVLIGPHNKLRGRGGAPLPNSALPDMPIMQVELARSADDLVKVLTPGNLERNLRDARAGNNLDTFLFIPAYSGLLISIGLILAQGDDRWRAMLVLVAVLAVPLAAVGDWTENHGITLVLDKLGQNTPLVDSDATRISTPSLFKWTITALALLLYGAAAARRLNRADRLLATLAVSGAVLGVVLLYAVARYLTARYHP